MKNVYFISYVGVEYGLNLLGFLIEHYLSLGIPSENFNIIINYENESNLNDAKVILDQYKMKPVIVHKSLNFIEHKLVAAQSIIDSKPNGSWFVYADADEFHEYEDSIQKMISYNKVVKGKFVDRLTDTGHFKEIKTDQPLFEQFPVETNLSVISNCEDEKVMLFRKRTRINTSGFHHIRNESNRKDALYENFQKVHHFKWDNYALQKSKDRVELQKANNIIYWKESDKIVKHYEKHGRINLEEI